MEESKIKYYGSLDGLRTIACIGIVIMHMMVPENNIYTIYGKFPLLRKVILSFVDFVFLFMILSAFGLCCAYHDRMLKGTISLSVFYKKRYSRILPFFACVVIMDLLVHFNRETIIEAIADISLTFGLFPNSITVIGVGWFLGVVFAFYLLFPFFCVITETKTKTWISLAISLVLNYIGSSYFNLDRTNIVFSSCYFIAGALVFHYRDQLETISWYFSLLFLIGSVVLYFSIGGNTYTCLLVSVMLVAVAIGSIGRYLQNKFTKFFSAISMEIYLSHMAMFRIIEKLHLNYILGDGLFQSFLTIAMVLIASIIFALGVKRFLANVYKLFDHFRINI